MAATSPTLRVLPGHSSGSPDAPSHRDGPERPEEAGTTAPLSVSPPARGPASPQQRGERGPRREGCSLPRRRVTSCRRKRRAAPAAPTRMPGREGKGTAGGAGAAALTQPPAGTRRADPPATPPRGRRSRAAARRPLAAAPHTFAGDWPAGGREPRPPPRARARGRRRPSGERRTKRGKPGELRRHLGAASDPPVSDPGIPGDRDCWDRGSPRGWCGTGNPRVRLGASYDRRDRGQEIGLGRRLEGLSRGGGLELLECAVGEPPAWGALRGAGRRGNPREGGKEGGKPPRTCWQRRSGAVQPLLPQCTTGCGHWHRQLHVPGGSDEGGGESRGDPGATRGGRAARRQGSGAALREEPAAAPVTRFPQGRRFASLPPRREASGVAALTPARPPPAVTAPPARAPSPRPPSQPAAAARRRRGRRAGNWGKGRRAAAPDHALFRCPAPGRALLGPGQSAPGVAPGEPIGEGGGGARGGGRRGALR